MFQFVHLRLSPLSLPYSWSSSFPFYYCSSALTGPWQFHTITEVIFLNEVLILLFPSLEETAIFPVLNGMLSAWNSCSLFSPGDDA